MTSFLLTFLFILYTDSPDSLVSDGEVLEVGGEVLGLSSSPFLLAPSLKGEERKGHQPPGLVQGCISSLKGPRTTLVSSTEPPGSLEWPAGVSGTTSLKPFALKAVRPSVERHTLSLPSGGRPVALSSCLERFRIISNSHIKTLCHLHEVNEKNYATGMYKCIKVWDDLTQILCSLLP